MKQSVNNTARAGIPPIVINGASEAEVIPMLVTQMVPLAKLVVSKLNVRKHGTKDIESLAASIASKGLLQPLLVRKLDDNYEVIFGGRRTLALRKLNAEGHPNTDFVPCIVSEFDDARAIEASLAENIERLPMDELDQYDAFAAMIKNGRTASEIAQHFGITAQTVNRRLALSRLIGEVKALYRDGGIESGDLQTLTLATKAKQRAFVKEAQDGNAPSGRYLKQWLLGGAEIATTAALFPLENYKGPIAADLFGEASYFADTDAFWVLQVAEIARLKAELEEKGWSVDVLGPQTQFCEWRYTKMSKTKGGRAIIVAGSDGVVTTHTGLIHEDELRNMEKAKRCEGEADAPKVTRRPELTEALSTCVELLRHSAVRAALVGNPTCALRLAVAQLIGGSTHWSARIEGRQCPNAGVAAAVKDVGEDKRFAEARMAAHTLLGTATGGEDTEVVGSRRHLSDLYARLTALSDAETMQVLAVVVAETLAVGTAVVDVVGTELGASLHGWKPQESFLQLVRDKEVLGAMVADVAGQAEADRLVTATGSTLREAITRGMASNEAWLPRWLAFPQQRYSDRPLSARPKKAG